MKVDDIVKIEVKKNFFGKKFSEFTIMYKGQEIIAHVFKNNSIRIPDKENKINPALKGNLIMTLKNFLE